ncbi:hypothetical protein GGQ79_001740 [Ochrobactrum pecoris]|uniref:Uncharacterized protein n=1 Tax=Brucella pecoris TaxID=867683 RepID=A0AB34YPK6_9HYPH|nr:hypothetical protein [Brucella pecoris]
MARPSKIDSVFLANNVTNLILWSENESHEYLTY